MIKTLTKEEKLRILLYECYLNATPKMTHNYMDVSHDLWMILEPHKNQVTINIMMDLYVFSTHINSEADNSLWYSASQTGALIEAKINWDFDE